MISSAAAKTMACLDWVNITSRMLSNLSQLSTSHSCSTLVLSCSVYMLVGDDHDHDKTFL